MRIQEIEIDRFRIWRNLTLPLNRDGLNVFYGPNEAGKTTLMRFVRAVLYGFAPEDVAGSGRAAPWRGSVGVEHRGRRFSIRRTAETGGRGRLEVRGFRKQRPPERQLSRLLARTSEEVFEDIFAIGLKELQQLATMDSEDVADRIYGLSLGSEGRALLAAIADVRESRLQLLDAKHNQGRLPDLFDRYEQLLAEGPRYDGSREKHAALCRERGELEQQIDQLRRRENVLDSNLTGYRHLQRCSGPWNRIRTLQAELAGLPAAHEVPGELFDQIRQLDEKIHAAERQRDTARAACEQARRQAAAVGEASSLDRHAPAVQSLVAQADWLRQLEEHLQSAQQRSQTMRHEVDQALLTLGGDWTIERLEAVDSSPMANGRLLKMARVYRTALSRRGKLRRLNRRLSKRTQGELVEFNQRLEQLKCDTIADAIELERTRLARLEDVAQLKLQVAELQHRSATIRRLVSRIDSTATVPEWIDSIFTVFGVVGVLLFFAGLLLWAFGGWGSGSLYGALAGAAIGAAGLTWFFCRLGLKNHFDSQAGLRLDDLQDEARETETRLVGIRSQLAGLIRESGQLVPSDGTAVADASGEVDLIRQTVHRIAELEGLSREEARLSARRERLATLRGRFRAAQQQVMQRRNEWVSLLRSVGLTETVKTSEVFELWQKILDVREVHQKLQQAQPEVESTRRVYQALCERIREVGQRTDGADLDYSRPLTVLAAWKEELKSLERDRENRQRVLEEAAQRQREADEAVQVVERLHVQRGSLLAKAGVASVIELEQQQEWIELRREAEQQLQVAREELNEIAAAEPHMALAEEDLLAYDEETAREAIELAELELDEIGEKLGAAREKLGSVKRELETLETSRAGLSARFERGQVAGQIHRVAEEWFALQLADGVVDEMRRSFEKSNVSGTLAIASRYLEQLTQGRYTRVWTPLGKQRLCVDDRLGRTFRVEQLSGGTREQLFLAIRFALVQEFSEKGIELPMVMDDLFVNFDEGRTAAAIDALIQFADSGQQVLFFTCHRHLAGMFEKRGVRPVWLPGPAAAEVEASADGDEDWLDDDDDADDPEPGASLTAAADADEADFETDDAGQRVAG